MQSTRVVAGFIAASDSVIHVVAPTQEEALKRAHEMDVLEPERIKVFPATLGLMTQFKAEGGEIAFPIIEGIACTFEEADALLDAG